MRIPSLINPLSAEYQCWETFKNELTVIQKVAAVAAAILGSIIPVIGTTYAFRKVVLHFDQQIQLEKEKQQTQLEEAWNQSDKIRYDLMINSNYINFVKKLCKLGIGPNDSPFEHLWIVRYQPSNANTLFGPEAQGQFPSSMHVEIQREFEGRTGLFIFIAYEAHKKEMASSFINKPDYAQLSVDQVRFDEPLPQSFVNRVKNGFQKV